MTNVEGPKAGFKPAYTLHRMTPADLDAVRAFFADHLQRPPGWFEWQYLDNPDGFDVRVCRADGKVVGMSGFVPCRVERDGVRETAAFSTNTLVHPEHRGRGIGRRIHEARLRDYDWALSSGQSAANARVYRRLGFTERGRYRRLFVQTCPPRVRASPRFLRETYSWVVWLARGSARAPSLRVRVDRHAPRVTEAYYRERFGDGVGGPIWDYEHIAWRYERHPYFDYAFASVLRSDEVIGFAVIRRTANSVELVDLYTRYVDMADLLRAIGQEFRGLITGVFVGRALHAVFWRAGWTSFRVNNRLFGMSSDPTRDNLASGGSWCFLGGDSDTDR